MVGLRAVRAQLLKFSTVRDCHLGNSSSSHTGSMPCGVHRISVVKLILVMGSMGIERLTQPEF